MPKFIQTEEGEYLNVAHIAAIRILEVKHRVTCSNPVEHSTWDIEAGMNIGNFSYWPIYTDYKTKAAAERRLLKLVLSMQE